MKKSVKRSFQVIILILFSWFFLHVTYLLIDGLHDNIKPANLAVILGNEVLSTGQPSDRLKARLDKGLELYNQNLAPIIVVSGGQSKDGLDEAQVMANYLIEHQVPASVIILDSQGLNTEMTAENTAKIMKDRGYQSVIIVSQYFHITRTKLAFQKAGILEIYSAHPNFFEWRDLYSIPREFIGFYSYLLR